ncbi:NYN domain-containing protein [Nostoc sp. CMAA1605]|uniref:NYN domain-containing protein n=1 Tax=Nostoc sp. CMAA1605 TaxID=2055159 RepID=UPI001F3F6881|nr:NYN domain-containing protein [Nostoc sp. CMAA1605]MCF4967921.1 NYN domain-containing protein [Nostoc sp. CMAA1605]
MKIIHKISNIQTTPGKPVVALYWDYQNVKLSLETAKVLLEIANSKGILVRKNIYYNSKCNNQIGVKKELASLNLDYRDVPCPLKNSADNQLIADCLEDIDSVDSEQSPDVVILVSGDGDYVKLVRHLKKLNLQVIIFAQTGNVKQKLIEVADQFYFTDELIPLLQTNGQHQNTSFHLSITYNEGIKHLTQAIKILLQQEKKTTFSSIDQLMRKLCDHYQGFSSICKPDGTKFKNFSQFVDAAVKDGKVQKHNQQLFLIDLEVIAA